MNRSAILATVALALLTKLPAQEAEQRLDITYVQRGRQKMKLDLWLPAGPGPHPVVLLMHGGGWALGHRRFADAYYLSQAIVRAGLAVASVSYRFAPRHPHPAQIEDCRSAIQYLRLHAKELRIDPALVAACGASSGGHLATLLAMQDDQADPEAVDPVGRMSTRVACVVSISAPMVLEFHRGDGHHPISLELLRKFLGVKKTDITDDASVQRVLARALEASPHTYVTRDDPPVILVQGGRDPIVVPAHATRMQEKLAEAAVVHELVMLPDGGHCEFLFPLRDTPNRPPEWWKRCVGFLKRHLQAPRAASRWHPPMDPALR